MIEGLADYPNHWSRGGGATQGGVLSVKGAAAVSQTHSGGLTQDRVLISRMGRFVSTMARIITHIRKVYARITVATDNTKYGK